MRYFDAFSQSGYHSAFLTTFTFGTAAFEDIALPRLWSSGCRNVHVIADEAMVNREFLEIGPPRKAGTYYHLVKERRPGAFHPKIMLQLGRDRARLFVGSANLTAPGLAGNLELVSVIECSGKDDPCASLILGALRYVRGCVTQEDEWFEKGLNIAVARSPWLSEVSPSDVYVHPEQGLTGLIHDQADTSAIEQFAALIGDDPIHRVTVVSPYWDSGLAGLAGLRQQLGLPEIRVAIEPARGLFPRDVAARMDRLSVHDLGCLDQARRFHAKLLVCEGQAFDHVLSGSMNCSSPALMHLNGQPRNAEAGMYKRVKAGTAILALGIAPCFETALPIEDLPPFEEAQDTTTEPSDPLDGGSVAKVRTELAWRASPGTVPDGCLLTLFGQSGEVLAARLPFTDLRGDRWVLVLPEDPARPCYAVIHFADGRDSAPVAVCDLVALPVSTKEVARGRAASLLSALESIHDEDLRIVEILVELERLSDSKPESAGILKKLLKREGRTPEEAAPQKLTYDQFIAGRDKLTRGAVLGVEPDTEGYLSDVRRALNRIIGILSDHAISGDGISAGDEIDLGPTEPVEEDPGEPIVAARAPPAITVERRESVRQARAHTSQQVTQAAVGFAQRMTHQRDSAITLADLIHLRALLQLILAFAMPPGGSPSGNRMLPAYAGLTSDWTRLVGQVVQSLYVRGDDPFSTLEVAGDTRSVPGAVLECWAAVMASVNLAIKALKKQTQAGPVRSRLENFQAMTARRIKAEIESDSTTHAEFMKFLDQFESRFKHLEV